MDKNIKAEEQYTLLDSFSLNGTDKDGFKEAVTVKAAHTRDEVIDPEDLTWLHILNGEPVEVSTREKYGIADDKAVVYSLNEAGCRRAEEEGRPPLATVAKEDFSEDQFAEMTKKTCLGLKIWDEKFSIGENAFQTLNQRGQIAGLGTLVPTYSRNLFLASSIFRQGSAIHFVWEEDGAYKKVFAAFGSKYTYVPQTILLDVLDKLESDGTLGAPVVKGWLVNHERSLIVVEYPDAADDFTDSLKLPKKVIPGVLLETSDIGMVSITAEVVYRLDGMSSYIAPEILSIRHSGDIDAEDVISQIDDKLFPAIRKLPEALADLMGREVLNYSAADLNTSKGQEANVSAVSKAYDKAVCGRLTAFLGKKRRKALLEALVSEINPKKRYTYYDIAVSLMELPDRIDGIDHNSISFSKFEELVGQIPYQLQKQSKKSSAGDDDVTLI